MADESERARRAVIELCPSNECRIRETCTRVKGLCRLRPPLDEIAQNSVEKSDGVSDHLE